MDRTINFGDDAADARYRIQDTSSTGGDLVLAEDLDGGTVLLEYDYSASEWVSRGPVNLNGNDITNAGAISADTLEAGSLDSSISDFSNKSKSAGTEYQNTAGHLIEVSIQITQTTGSPANISSSIRVGTSSGLTGVDTEELTQIEIGNGDVVTTTAIVPDQSYYSLELFGNGKVDTWREREWSN